MKNLVALALTLTACTSTDSWPWHDGTPIAVVVQTDAPEASALAFKARVQRDIALWNDALVKLGCTAPMRYVDDVSDAWVQLNLLDRAHWPFPGAVGAQFPGEIDILSGGDGTLDKFVDDPWWIVVEHELGHGLGLEHSPYTDSVMQEFGEPDVMPLSHGDVERAADAMGCR